MTKLVFGCGYLGRRISQRWLEDGDEVWVVTRSSARAKELESCGFHAVIADVTQPGSLCELPAAESVLYAVGYDRSTGLQQRQVYVDGLTHVLEHLPHDKLERFIYISSTGVYGQSDGSWVDEDSICQPTRAGGQCCLEAENRLARVIWGDRRIVLRLAGIYGPSRIPNLRLAAAGEIARIATDGYLNLIHVDDAVRVVLAAELRARTPTLYTVSDGQPVLRSDFYAHVLRWDWPVMDKVQPGQGSPARPASRQQRTGSSKRVVNQRMLRELGVQLEHKNYQEGLAAIARQCLGE